MSDYNKCTLPEPYLSPTINVASRTHPGWFRAVPNPQYIQQKRVEALEKELRELWELQASFKVTSTLQVKYDEENPYGSDLFELATIRIDELKVLKEPSNLDSSETDQEDSKRRQYMVENIQPYDVIYQYHGYCRVPLGPVVVISYDRAKNIIRFVVPYLRKIVNGNLEMCEFIDDKPCNCHDNDPPGNGYVPYNCKCEDRAIQNRLEKFMPRSVLTLAITEIRWSHPEDWYFLSDKHELPFEADLVEKDESY